MVINFTYNLLMFIAIASLLLAILVILVSLTVVMFIGLNLLLSYLQVNYPQYSGTISKETEEDLLKHSEDDEYKRELEEEDTGI